MLAATVFPTVFRRGLSPRSLEYHGERCSPLRFSLLRFVAGYLPAHLNTMASDARRYGFPCCVSSRAIPLLPASSFPCPLECHGERCSPLRFSLLRFVAGYSPAPLRPAPLRVAGIGRRLLRIARPRSAFGGRCLRPAPLRVAGIGRRLLRIARPRSGFAGCYLPAPRYLARPSADAISPLP